MAISLDVHTRSEKEPVVIKATLHNSFITTDLIFSGFKCTIFFESTDHAVDFAEDLLDAISHPYDYRSKNKDES